MKDTLLDGLTFKMLEQVRTRMNMDPALVEDICLGNVRDGKASYYCRVAALAAGFPSTTAASSSSRFCSSGLTATQHIATSIATGVIDIGIAVGAELLSTPIPRLDRDFVEEVLQNQEARDCMIPMGKQLEIKIERTFIDSVKVALPKLSPRSSTSPARTRTDTP